MKGTFLDKAVAKARERVARAKSDRYPNAFRRKAEAVREQREAHRFRNALTDPDRINIIAEFKRASASKGVINARVDVGAQARKYAAGGAAAISVLTEPEYFQGSMDDLLKVRNAVDTPMLRKDFIVDEYQLVEAAAAGADAILLIVAALADKDLAALRRVAEEQLGIDALVEIHDKDELLRAIDLGATVIGVNNRNLRNLEVSLDVSRELAVHKPNDKILVAESGLSSRDEIDELRDLGYDAFLIGETLMRSTDIETELRALTKL